MDRKGNTALVVVVGIAVAVALFVVLSGGEESTPTSQPTTAPKGEVTDQTNQDAGQADKPEPDQPKPDKPKPEEPATPVIEVKGGKPVGGVQELSFTAGDRIRFDVVSDVADTVHLHGYDIEQPVKAGGETSFDLSADIEGVFEVELEERVVPIAEIVVNPG